MNRPTKILFCSVLAVISFLCLGAVFTAPPPFWRNAWSTNQPPRTVTGVNNLTVSNFNSTTGWQFWAVGPKTVARLGDVTGIVNAASSPGLTTNANQFLGVPLAIIDKAKLTNTFIRGTNWIGDSGTQPSIIFSNDNSILNPPFQIYYSESNTPYLGFFSGDFTADSVRFDANGPNSVKYSLWGNGGAYDYQPHPVLDLNLGGDTNKLLIASSSYFHAIGIDIGASEKVYISTNGIKPIGLTASRAAVIGTAGYITNATGTPDGTQFLRDDNTYAVPPGTTGITTNANQFLGVPLSLKDGVQVTNLTNSGVLTGAIGVFTQITNSGNETFSGASFNIVDGFAVQRISVSRLSNIGLKGTNGNVGLTVGKDGASVLIGSSGTSFGSTPLATLDIQTTQNVYQVKVNTNSFVVTNGLVAIGGVVPLAKFHLTNSTAQTAFRIDQQNTTNPIVQIYNNNTLTSEFTTNGLSTLTSNLLAPTGITAPATTVNWTNPIPENIEVYVDNAGVTGTSIKKNGTQIFSSVIGDVTLGLQRGEYFSITYSVGTPVVKWSPR